MLGGGVAISSLLPCKMWDQVWDRSRARQLTTWFYYEKQAGLVPRKGLGIFSRLSLQYQ